MFGVSIHQVERRILVGVSRGLLALTFATTGCSDEANRVQAEVESPDGEQAQLSNELVALKIRGERKEDRFVISKSWGKTNLDYEAPGEAGGVAAEIAMLEPGADWQSERLSAAVVGQVDLLLQGKVAEVAEPRVMATVLRPLDLKGETLASGYLVFRPEGDEWKPKRAKGVEELAEAVSYLLAVFEGHQMKSKTKVITVNLGVDDFETTILIELRCENSPSPLQITATWSARWSVGEVPRLRSLDLIRYEEVQQITENGGGFTDVTHHVLGGTPHYRSQVLTGTDFWASRITRLGDFSLTGHHGFAVGDVNGDGREDLYVCDAGSLPNRLYVQQEDGTLRDVSREAGVDWLEDSRSALLVDLDNDGDQDLVLATIAMITFSENDGTGKFTLRGGHPLARYPFSLSAADYDNDGDLDIYACVYSTGDDASGRGFESSSPLPFNDAENGGRNILLSNLGEFQIADATHASRLDLDNTRWSFAAAWEDYDRDGDPDLYVANDFGRNCFYRNDGGTFSQVAAELGVEDMASGMSGAWGDYNRDGAADLYVGNMFSSAGRRVSTQSVFSSNASDPLVAGLNRMARGNTLFEGDRQGGFRDVSEPTRTFPGRWAWSSGFVDINNDGWEDLAIANGYLTGRKADDL